MISVANKKQKKIRKSSVRLALFKRDEGNKRVSERMKKKSTATRSARVRLCVCVLTIAIYNANIHIYYIFITFTVLRDAICAIQRTMWASESHTIRMAFFFPLANAIRTQKCKKNTKEKNCHRIIVCAHTREMCFCPLVAVNSL